MKKTRWELAKVIRADAMPLIVGKLVWCNHAIKEPCGDGGCKEPSIGVNLIWGIPFWGPVDGVMHLTDVDLLSVFSDDIPMIDGHSWKGMDNLDIIRLMK